MKGKKLLTYVLASSMSVSLFAGLAVTTGAETLTNEANDEISAESENTSADETMQQLQENFKTGFNEDGTVDQTVYDYSAENENVDTLSDEYDSSFDLRHVGGKVIYNEKTKKSEIKGGVSYVTPVKLQNPWGTCWAFGIIAAAESSILSESGESTTTVDNDNLDLSERHLAWFAKNHIPAPGEIDFGVNDVNGQDGEGLWYIEDEGGESMSGGYDFYGVAALSQGIGVVDEEDCPYVGKDEMVEARRNDDADKTKYTAKYLYYDSVDDWYNETDEDIKANYHLFSYSDKDDWSVDESQRFEQDYVLEEGNILPSVTPITDEETGETVLNEDGINAVKAELTKGRGVQMAFMADNSDPDADVTSNTARYINSNYAHYCWDQTASDHVVCIVGWDDDYSASNFGQDEVTVWDSYRRVVYKLIDSDQQLEYDNEDKTNSTLYYTDAKGVKHTYDVTKDSDKIEPVKESGESSTPPGDGAWIVKNSWGNATNEFPNKEDWGVDGSGYFYVSYYDTSVCGLTTYDFAVTDDEQEENDCTIVDQYNYMLSDAASTSWSSNPVMMANVFTADQNMEIDAVSCETNYPGTTVTYSICLLEDDEDYPSEDDEIAYKATETYEYGGYHKLILEEPVVVAKGQKYAVIAKETFLAYADEESDAQTFYSICSNSDYTEYCAEAYDINDYSIGVINPGESYIGAAGYNSDEYVWTDYYDFLTANNVLGEDAEYYTYDNFSLKAFGNPTDKTAPVLESAVNTKDGVKVSWESKGTGYDYRLFMRKSGTTEWTVVADTDSTSYTVTGLKNGTSYDFTVRCVDDTGMHYITKYDKTGVSCVRLPYITLKAKATSKSIILSWTKAKGAKGYKIYRKSGTSGYTLIGRVYGSTNLSYRDATAEKGVKYTYKVKPYSTGCTSKSNAVSVKRK